MRAVLTAALSAAVLVTAGGAFAQSAPTVTVTLGPELQSKVDKIGARDVDELKSELAKQVARALAKSGGQRADLVLEAASPNRPTMEQLRRVPGLSFWSLGVGGASVTGSVTRSDGTTQPVSYRWYETDIRQVMGYTTWTDAERAFDRLSYRIARGDVPNLGPHRPGDKMAGLFGDQRYY